MNMKTALALTALTAAGAASAAVTSANTLCRIQIDSTAKSTIVAVPLAKVGGGNIPVTELVLTDNLTAGDTILHWNGTAWDAWMIEDGAWKPTVISEGSKNSKSAPAEGTSLARGDAIWVNRQTTTNPFYIYGQVATTAGTSNATAGESSAPAYTLMGNSKLEAVELSALVYANDTTPRVGDKIVVGNPENAFGYDEYTWETPRNVSPEARAWCVKGRYTDPDGVRHVGWVAPETAVIQPGVGFWYVSFGGSPTIKW